MEPAHASGQQPRIVYIPARVHTATLHPANGPAKPVKQFELTGYDGQAILT
jgi:hypothetical protein